MGVINVKEVSKVFNKNKILEDINLSIEKGEILAVLGPSGSGKSVLIKLLIGFLKPTKGNITRNESIGFSMQDNSLYNNLTLKQNLNYFADLNHVPNKKEKINSILEKLSLTGYKNILAANLSGGTKKRADIACALLTNPKILILDEPFVGLDTFLVKELTKRLKTLQEQGITIILSSHLLNQVENLCDRFIFIKNTHAIEISKKDIRSLYKND
jgi:ABC-2 type transport system ATP-binding protein